MHLYSNASNHKRRWIIGGLVTLAILGVGAGVGTYAGICLSQAASTNNAGKIHNDYHLLIN